MHHADFWAVCLAILAFTAVPPSLALPLIGIFGKRWKLSVIFAAVLGGFGFLSLGIAALGRSLVTSGNASDQYGLMAFGLAVSIPPFGAACVLAGRALTTERVWKVVGSGLLLALGITVALGCLLVHQFLLAQHSGRASEAAWIIGGLFGGIPVALVGLVLAAYTAAKAEPAT